MSVKGWNHFGGGQMSDGVFSFGDSDDFKLKLDPELFPDGPPTTGDAGVSNPNYQYHDKSLDLRLDQGLMATVDALIHPKTSAPAPARPVQAGFAPASSSWFSQSTSIGGLAFPNWSLAGLGALAAVAFISTRRR